MLDRQRGELHVLNPAAALLWLLLEECSHTPETLIAHYHDLRGTCSGDEDQSPLDILHAWENLGWLVRTGNMLQLNPRTPDALSPYASRAEVLSAKPLLLSDDTKRLKIALSRERACHITFMASELSDYPDAIPRLHALLSGLQIPDTESPAPTTQEPVPLQFAIEGSAIYVGTPHHLLRTTDESFGLSALASAILRHSYEDRQIFATLHAAALAFGQQSIVFPGISGSGKSTLAAYLTAHGWTYLGDDVIALGRVDSLGEVVLPFCTAIGLKPGSWDILTPWYPALPSLPVIPYADRQARFLPMPSQAGSPCAIKAFVFPEFSDGADLLIRTLDPAEALTTLIQAGATAGLSPDPDHIIQLVTLLQSRPCYKITYSSLTAVRTWLEQL